MWRKKSLITLVPLGQFKEQSKALFAQMQEQMQKQAGSLFPGEPGFPGAKR